MDIRRKNSKKRQAILDVLCSTKEHPTAEMIYNRLKPDYPELSLGTVYRNLGILVQEGLVVTVGQVAGHERYDGVTEPHGHFICRGCNHVLDMPLNLTVDGFCKKLDMEYGFQSESCSVSVSGLCPRCSGQGN